MSHVPHYRLHPLHGKDAHPILFGRFRLVLGLSLMALLVCGVSIFCVSAQQNGSPEDRESAFNLKADKLLREVRRADDEDRLSAREGRLREDNSKVERLSRIARVRRKEDGAVSVGVIVELTETSAAELTAAGFAVRAQIGDIATVETDADRLPELASLSSVRQLSAAVYRHPLNDRARQAVGIDNSSGQRVVSQTGRGVVVGIIDSGIDFRHPDFTVSGSNGQRTRIKALLDMTYYGTVQSGQSIPADPGWNYTLPGQSTPIGHLYTEADINAALQAPKPASQNADPVKERDTNGHGTHVAGTAAGNGLAAPSAPGTYAGMAPEADLVIVKASRENDGNAGFGTDDIINGLNFIQQKAGELGEPFVINMSLGGHGGSPHDGTDPDERAIDNLVNGAPGRAVCVAAGNEGGSGIHASGNVPAGGNVALSLNASSSPQSFTLYYPNSDRFSVTVTLPDNSTLSSGAFNGAPASNNYLTIYSGTDNKQDSDPTNDQSSVFIIFKNGAEKLGANWTFTLHGDSVTNGHFDAWVEDGSFAAPYVDDSRLVGSPGTSRGAITVGAYVTRSASQTIGNYAFFTSPGPTADGRQKPDISAPGYYLYSSRSTDINAANGVGFTIGSGSNAPVDSVHYGGLAGTSMATPVTTGAIALLLQANRNMSADQIKQLIETTAIHDGFTGGGWNPRFGNGKLSIAAAINTVAPPVINPPAVNQIDDARFFVTQHYLDFLNRQPDQGGLDYWTGQLTACGSDQNCMLARRVTVSAAYFTSTEFQQTGYYIYRFYKGSLGQPPSFVEFMADRNQVVGGATLDAGKTAFASNWVTRPAFTAKYPSTMTGAQFVDTLLATVQATDGVDLSAQRSALISQYDGTDSGRAGIVRAVVESQAFADAEYNPAFVLMQYFGYLRRDPDSGGYNFWLGVLNATHNPNGMTCAFITSSEYQLRFGSAVTHTNRDCGQ